MRGLDPRVHVCLHAAQKISAAIRAHLKDELGQMKSAILIGIRISSFRFHISSFFSVKLSAAC
ncbi:MAG: hypothetical protein WD688_15880 [Candidatus Binatia bacterium]